MRYLLERHHNIDNVNIAYDNNWLLKVGLVYEENIVHKSVDYMSNKSVLNSIRNVAQWEPFLFVSMIVIQFLVALILYYLKIKIDVCNE